ncbi:MULTISPECIES: ankyrin repeat domain-containing protein [unclassified Pasteurella]|uniref:ankyrin repeat domain-containing protein n=1 Tax=unclassified Pasteurella TaxID=2621516 RepID=UPI001072FB68|nr:hypothetical protein [Pasteurella sp. 19428wF3_WM03]TFU49377.1 hypothetical protein E4T92_10900 [Pasteurella sp. WM03]
MKILQIKKYLAFFILSLYLSMISIYAYSNETEKNRRLIPEKFFSGSHLEMAQAIHKNDRAKVEKLLKQGIDVNEISETNTMTYLLYSVMLENRFEIAELLLKNNANPNKVSMILSNSKKYKFYYLPLTSVSSDESIEYMKLLLKYGADPNYFYRDDTGDIALNAMPAINAAVRSAYILNKWNREDFMNDIKARIELLLENGADINSIGSVGKTVVEWADSNPEIVLYLMDKGADHRLYGKELLRTSKRLLQANPNNIHRQEIIRRLEALGYK